MTYTIRKATKEDIHPLSVMFHTTVGEINSKDYTQEQIKAWQNKATPERWLELWNSNLEFIVAENSERRIIGFASFNKDGYIHSMFVHHLHQGEGIATDLLCEIEQQLHCSRLTSEVSITAKPFFEKMGFHTVKQQSVSLGNIELVNYVMSKTLLNMNERRVMNTPFKLFLFLCLLIGSSIHAQNSTPTLRFGLFADVQYANCPSDHARFYGLSLQKLDTCIDYFNRQNIQFAVNLGDIIDRKNSDLDSVKYCLSYLDSPIYHTTGNHDYKEVTDNATLYKQLGMPSEYYAFSKQNWTFVMLNTNEVSAYAQIKGTDKEQELAEMLEHIKQSGGKQALRWNGGISKKQMQWLDELLTTCEKNEYCKPLRNTLA